MILAVCRACQDGNHDNCTGEIRIVNPPKIDFKCTCTKCFYNCQAGWRGCWYCRKGYVHDYRDYAYYSSEDLKPDPELVKWASEVRKN